MILLVEHLKFAWPERAQLVDATLCPIKVSGGFKPQQFARIFFADDAVVP
jgi:hypothetical protein